MPKKECSVTVVRVKNEALEAIRKEKKRTGVNLERLVENAVKKEYIR